MDALADVRMYARGYLAGAYSAELDEAIAYEREAVVLVALSELGVSASGARAILEQARCEAYQSVPDCTEMAARIIGANMVIAILQRRLIAIQREIVEAAA